ncbi:microfibril-associated glycoprotein 4-like [Watersipora subatra]|uniref:microfibril-associated glycoprotein 4-like n=1 Tax=Watersipora subatra TaxID=2589382 RepID=UPI00355B9140
MVNADQHVIGQNAKSQELLHLQQKINAARQLLQNVTNQLSFKQTQAAEEATSIPSASQHPLTEQLTTEQSVTSEVPTPKDCQELYEQGNRLSGVYQINPPRMAGEHFPVWCEFVDGHGWTVFQKRINGYVDFLRNWTDYQTGFGDIDGEYWLGLDKIHALTSTNTKLSILLKTVDGNTESGIWQSFYINDSSDGYRLSISNDGYRGSLGAFCLDYHNGMKFSTPDRDQDNNVDNCAQEYKGGWWYNSCLFVILNRVYDSNGLGGIMWSCNPNQFTESEMRVTRD